MARLVAVIKELTTVQKPSGNAANPRIERASVVVKGSEIHSESTTR